ncbi:MAG: hypothetical protein AAFN70_19940, partial [Planctomycetota bacterium]
MTELQFRMSARTVPGKYVDNATDHAVAASDPPLQKRRLGDSSCIRLCTPGMGVIVMGWKSLVR